MNKLNALDNLKHFVTDLSPILILRLFSTLIKGNQKIPIILIDLNAMVSILFSNSFTPTTIFNTLVMTMLITLMVLIPLMNDFQWIL